MAIFSGHGESNELKSLSGDDGWAFVDKIDEVSTHTLPLLEDGLIDPR